MKEKKLAAVDIGAGSGRLFLARFDGSKLKVSEQARFFHTPVAIGCDVYLNFLNIFDAVCGAMCQTGNRYGKIDSVAFDSFAPDFCLFDKNGYLISNMLSYRTVLGTGILKEVLDRQSERTLFDACGLQSSEILLLPQLLYLLKTNRRWMLEFGRLLPLPGALNYMLTGHLGMDFTNASISMLWDSKNKTFSRRLIDAYIGFDDFLPSLTECQSIVGQVRKETLGSEYAATRVVNAGGHDTAVATYALNCMAKNQLCMNCGTWISIAIVCKEPIINETAYQSGLTNYGLPDGKYMFGKVMLGLFYLRQCRDEWRQQGHEVDYAEMGRMAITAESDWILDLDDPSFQSTQSSILERISTYFQLRGQCGPISIGEITRCILESLAVRCAVVIREIEAATECSYDSVYMGGGGIQEKLLCEFIAKKTGKRVECVDVEVTVMGNILSQLVAQNEIMPEDAAQIWNREVLALQ